MLSAVFFVLINAVVFCASWFGISYSRHMESHISIPLMHAETAIFILGMIGTVLSSTPIAFLLFWELMSVASFLLVLTNKTEASVRAGLFYFVMTQLGALAIMLGFAIVSGGDLFSPFAKAVLSDSASLYLPFFLFLIGFGSKAGLVPLHAWLPLAHPEAPSHISALMSGAMLKVALFGFLLVLTKIIAPLPATCGLIIIVIGLISGVYGAVNAVVEKDIKTLLAWSSIENIGLLFAMVGTAIYAGATGSSWLVSAALSIALFMAVNHALFKSGLFMSAGVLAHKLGTRNIDHMGGLAKFMPRFSKTVLVLSLAAAALPPAGAFFGEWAFLRALFFSLSNSSPIDKIIYSVVFAFVGLIGGLGVFAMTKYFGIAFLGQSRADVVEKISEPSMKGEVAPIGVTAVATLLLGVSAPWVFAALLGDSANPFGSAIGLSSFLTHGFTFVSILFVFALFLAYTIQRMLVAPATSRLVDTWDCGQPITPRMEYTGTGFAAPIRFFFLSILQSKKVIARTPIVSTNAYLRSVDMQIVERPLFEKIFYMPITVGLERLSLLARKLHKGAIGTYFVVMILTIIISLILGLWLK
jgi:hydrogenase-4 component B